MQRFSPSDLDEIIPPPGRYTCRGEPAGACSVVLQRPGICPRCADVAERREGASRVKQAIRREIPDRFGWARWSSPELAARVTGGARRVAAVRKALEPGRGVLIGGAGAGKTSLAVAWLRDRIEAGADRARFVAAIDLTTPSWIEGVSRLDLALSAGPLVLDDLGEELTSADGGNLSAMRIEAVVKLIRARHDQGLGIVITTGRDEAWVAKTYGDGIARRVFEGVAPVRLAA